MNEFEEFKTPAQNNSEMGSAPYPQYEVRFKITRCTKHVSVPCVIIVIVVVSIAITWEYWWPWLISVAHCECGQRLCSNETADCDTAEPEFKLFPAPEIPPPADQDDDPDADTEEGRAVVLIIMLISFSGVLAMAGFGCILFCDAFCRSGIESDSLWFNCNLCGNFGMDHWNGAIAVQHYCTRSDQRVFVVGKVYGPNADYNRSKMQLILRGRHTPPLYHLSCGSSSDDSLIDAVTRPRRRDFNSQLFNEAEIPANSPNSARRRIGRNATRPDVVDFLLHEDQDSSSTEIERQSRYVVAGNDSFIRVPISRPDGHIQLFVRTPVQPAQYHTDTPVCSQPGQPELQPDRSEILSVRSELQPVRLQTCPNEHFCSNEPTDGEGSTYPRLSPCSGHTRLVRFNVHESKSDSESVDGHLNSHCSSTSQRSLPPISGRSVVRSTLPHTRSCVLLSSNRSRSPSSTESPVCSERSVRSNFSCRSAPTQYVRSTDMRRVHSTISLPSAGYPFVRPSLPPPPAGLSTVGGRNDPVWWRLRQDFVKFVVEDDRPDFPSDVVTET
eukprot:71097_1